VTGVTGYRTMELSRLLQYLIRLLVCIDECRLKAPNAHKVVDSDFFSGLGPQPQNQTAKITSSSRPLNRTPPLQTPSEQPTHIANTTSSSALCYLSGTVCLNFRTVECFSDARLLEIGERFRVAFIKQAVVYNRWATYRYDFNGSWLNIATPKWLVCSNRFLIDYNISISILSDTSTAQTECHDPLATSERRGEKIVRFSFLPAIL